MYICAVCQPVHSTLQLHAYVSVMWQHATYTLTKGLERAGIHVAPLHVCSAANLRITAFSA